MQRWILALLLVLTFSIRSYGYPEMVRHGYANCTACHVSPNGGGILTPYGRSLSQELLSTWGAKNESDFMYGFVKLPEWLNLGGDIRSLQQWQKNDSFEQAMFIFMQADLEAAATVSKFQAVATVGPQSNKTFNHAGGAIISRRHYLAYHPTDQITIRGGKFMAAYGINTAEHVIATKRNLNWDEGSETYNIEASYLGDHFDAYATVLMGRPEASYLNLEKGVSLRSSYLLKETSKIGASYFYGSSDLANRHVFGPYGILGITPHFFVLAEFDFQYRLAFGAPNSWGFVNYVRADYEFIKGLHGYLTHELTKLNWNRPDQTTQTFGIGMQFFPRPHIEVQSALQKSRDMSRSSNFATIAWVMLHYYL